MAVTLNALTTGVGGLQTTGDTSGEIQLQTNGTATLTVNTSGNVGIGTAIPTFKLVSANSSTDGGWIYSSSAVSILGLGGYSGATDGAFSLRYDRGSGVVTFNGGTRDTPVERMRLGNSGEIGVGSTFNYGTSGQFLKSNGPGAAASWGTAGGGFSNMTVFTSPGTFTTPSTTTQIKVTVVGGGGGGGGGASNNGGGGGGGAAIYVGPVTASTPYAVTVGSGGPGGTAPANGTAGNTSSFASLASATGGSGGKISPLGNDSAGGAGGAGSAGTLQITGQWCYERGVCSTRNRCWRLRWRIIFRWWRSRYWD
jgi:hypothetical protein